MTVKFLNGSSRRAQFDKTAREIHFFLASLQKGLKRAKICISMLSVNKRAYSLGAKL